jgi:hypothetical protein
VRVQEEFLNAALHRVDKDFGGVQAYLVDVLGVDASAQKELAGSYLQRCDGGLPWAAPTTPGPGWRFPPCRRTIGLWA